MRRNSRSSSWRDSGMNIVSRGFYAVAGACLVAASAWGQQAPQPRYPDLKIRVTQTPGVAYPASTQRGPAPIAGAPAGPAANPYPNYTQPGAPIATPTGVPGAAP